VSAQKRAPIDLAAALADLGPDGDAAYQDTASSEAPPQTARIYELAHNPRNPRLTLRQIQDMADSLRRRGQIAPLSVVTRAAYLRIHPEDESEIKPRTARWIVVEGNRRLAGARQAELEELAIHVNDGLAASADTLLESAVIASLHNEHLTPLEEARAFEALVAVHGSHRAVAKQLSKSHVLIGQRIALLDLVEELQDRLESGDLKLEDARRIARLPRDQQLAAAPEIEAERERRLEGRRTRGASEPPERPVSLGSADAGSGPGAVDNSNERESGGNGVSTPTVPPGRTPDADSVGTLGESATASRGNAVTTPVPAADNGASPAGGGSAVSTSGPASGSADNGNGATSRPARANGALFMEWEDLAQIVDSIRRNLSAEQRAELAARIVD
jgi:ParB family transcriptional regulator, chromosome partitioning protein